MDIGHISVINAHIFQVPFLYSLSLKYDMIYLLLLSIAHQTMRDYGNAITVLMHLKYAFECASRIHFLSLALFCLHKFWHETGYI